MNALELRIPPVALVAIFAASMWIVSRAPAGLRFSIPGAAWMAAGLALTGVAIAVLGVAEFRRADTTVDPRMPDQSASLVTGGVYRYSRNPMYAGFLVALFGWGLYLGSGWSLLLLPVFVVYMNRFQIVPEERFMRAKFGDSYGAYSGRVRRWL